MTPQQWYYRKGTARFGPVSSSDIKKMAAEGKLVPTDLLRGVGMTEWIAASKVKGLFPKTEPAATPKPNKNDELGLAPLDAATTPEPVKPVVVSTSKPVAVPKSASQLPAKGLAKPVKPATPSVASTAATPKIAKPKTPVIATPSTGTPALAVSNTVDPFAPFGLEQTPAPDPFAIPATGFGNFDALVALEKQGQTIYREPSVVAEPDPFAASKTKKQAAASSLSDFGPAGYIGLMIAPFLFVLLIGFPIGVITAWVPFRIIAIAIAVGTAKMVGLIAGSCMLKVKIKNEVLALGYGGLVGFFTTYVFIAASFWTYINVSAYLWKIPQQQIQSAPREMDENGRSLVLRPDEQPQFPALDQPPITQEEEEEEEEENMEEDFGKDEEQIAVEAEWSQETSDAKRLQDRMELIERLFGKGITLVESILPFTLFKFLRIEIEFNAFRYLFYWLLMGGILVAMTAYSTWLANLGYDPTRD
ncbi:MAG: GYF domain-containing protein [Planctomycetaceae bacterium]|nr:GYF domain-containing protein [Planctomycetaceae bacterium]